MPEDFTTCGAELIGRPIRVQRQQTFGKISELAALRDSLLLIDKLIDEFVDIGITVREVELRFGNPSAELNFYARTAKKYGNRWILFSYEELVEGIIRADKFRVGWLIEEYQRSAHDALIRP